MSSRNPKDLHPLLQPLYAEFMKRCHAQGVDVLTTCTYRSGAEQNVLYNQGRTTSGAIVTNARAGQSAHNFMIDGKPAAKAFDIVVMVNGKPDWTGKAVGWQIAGKIGQELGLNWYGSPKSKFRELPHFELRG